MHLYCVAQKLPVQGAGKEAKKFKAKLAEARRDQDDADSIMAELIKILDMDVTDAMQSAERQKRDVDATLRALGETVVKFQKMTD